MAFLGIGVAMPMIAQGTARGIAVGNLRRAAALPELPTVGETFPGFQADNWYAILAPLGTPDAVVQRLHQAGVAAVRTPQVAQLLREGGTEPAPSESPAAFAAMLRENTERWRQSVRAAGFRPE